VSIEFCSTIKTNIVGDNELEITNNVGSVGSGCNRYSELKKNTENQ
jgi:hypothetical protein